MSRSYWVAPLSPFHVASGAAYVSSSTLADVSPLPNVILAPGQLEAGSEIELYASGNFSNTATPTLLLGFYYGAVAGVALAASTAITTTTGATVWPWQMWYKGRVRTVGTAGTIVGQGRLYIPTSLILPTVRYIPETAALRTVTIDTTIQKAVTVGAQWGTLSASNTLTCDDITVRITS